MSDEQPSKKPNFIPPSDTLGDVNRPDMSVAQMKSGEKTRKEIEQRLEKLFKSILEDIVNNLPQQESVSLDEFDQIIVDALTRYFDQKKFFKTGDDQESQYSEKTLLENKKRVVAFAGEFVSFLESKELIKNPEIKTNVLQAIDDLYMQRVGLKKEEPQAPVEEIPEPSLEFILGEDKNNDTEVPVSTEQPKAPEQTPALSKEKAQQGLARLSEIYHLMIQDGIIVPRRMENIVKVAEEMLVSRPDFRTYFMKYFSPVWAALNTKGKGEALPSEALKETPFGEPKKLLFLLVTMITALSSTNQETKNYLFKDSDVVTMGVRWDTIFIQAVAKLSRLAKNEENGQLRFEDIPELDFFAPKQDWEKDLIDKIFKKKPPTPLTQTA